MIERSADPVVRSGLIVVVSQGRESVVDAVASVRSARSRIVVVDASADGRIAPMLEAAFGSIAIVSDDTDREDTDREDTDRDDTDRDEATEASSLTVLLAPGAGVSEARNRALASTRCDLLAFLDDDAVAVEGWFDALRNGLGDATVAGGPVVADTVPAWCRNRFQTMLPMLPFTAPDVRKDPIGANFLVRRERAIALGGFREDLGLCARLGRTITNEDTEFFLRVRSSDGEPAMVPAAVVLHPVASSRSTLGWLVARAFRQGQSDAMLASGRFRLRSAAQFFIVHRDPLRRGWRGWLGDFLAQRAWALGMIMAPAIQARGSRG